MPFEFGDVVLVPFPFTDQRAAKKRLERFSEERRHPRNGVSDRAIKSPQS
jgi:hypothetical protein